MSILILVILYCFPDKTNRNKENILSIEKKLINEWLLKISTLMLNIKKNFRPMSLNISLKKFTLLELSEELITNHKYQSSTRFDHEKLNYIQLEFLLKWENLIGTKIRNGIKTITYKELSNMLKEFKAIIIKSAELKNFKYQ
jgi:hypothetical protein